MTTLRNLFLAGLITATLPACAPLFTQSPEGSIRPLNDTPLMRVPDAEPRS